MKGQFSLWVLIPMMLVIMGLLAYWVLVEKNASGSGPGLVEKLFGLGGLVIFGRGNGKQNRGKNKKKPEISGVFHNKKGIVLTTTLLATIIFVVVVALVIFLLYGTIQAEAGSTGSGFFFGAFDAILRLLPWVK